MCCSTSYSAVMWLERLIAKAGLDIPGSAALVHTAPGHSEGAQSHLLAVHMIYNNCSCKRCVINKSTLQPSMPEASEQRHSWLWCCWPPGWTPCPTFVGCHSTCWNSLLDVLGSVALPGVLATKPLQQTWFTTRTGRHGPHFTSTRVRGSRCLVKPFNFNFLYM